MSRITLVIATHNEEPATLIKTLQSALNCAGQPVEAIVVDDASNTPATAVIPKELLVKIITNRFRCGVGASRSIGVCHATGDYILITDSHMRFPQGWYEAAAQRIFGHTQTVYCATCLDMENNRAVYRGAKLLVCGNDLQAPGKYQVFEGVWLSGDTPDDAELSCIMGASYFIHRDWFQKLQPLRCLRSWGQDEVMMSIKSWLAGGDCRYLKPVEIAHRFWPSKQLPYRIPIADIIWNQMFAIHTLTPPAIANNLIAQLRQAHLPNVFRMAESMLKDNWSLVATEQAYNQTIFKRDFHWLARHFGFSLTA
jgi:glycosyltransferase involved in cell wall biosynthesis